MAVPSRTMAGSHTRLESYKVLKRLDKLIGLDGTATRRVAYAIRTRGKDAA